MSAAADFIAAGLGDLMHLGRAIVVGLLVLAAAKLLLEGAKLALAWCRGVWREA